MAGLTIKKSLVNRILKIQAESMTEAVKKMSAEECIALAACLDLAEQESLPEDAVRTVMVGWSQIAMARMTGFSKAGKKRR